MLDGGDPKKTELKKGKTNVVMFVGLQGASVAAAPPFLCVSRTASPGSRRRTWAQAQLGSGPLPTGRAAGAAPPAGAAWSPAQLHRVLPWPWPARPRSAAGHLLP